MIDVARQLEPILVTGATGAQGGQVAQALLKEGAAVRVLVRNPESASAQALLKLGAVLSKGDFEDEASLARAVQGVRGVFSVQLYNPREPDAEQRQARALIQAARGADVPTFVQTSVSGTALDRNSQSWNEGRWDAAYWDNKAAVERMALEAGFASAVVLCPAFMMENLIPPKVRWMFPDLAAGQIITAADPETRIAFVAARDIGRAAAAAFADPVRFANARIELAGERLTFAETAAILSHAWGCPIAAETRPPSDLIARGQSPGWVQTQEWLNLIGYPAQPEELKGWGVAPTSLAEWAKAHAPADQGAGA